MENWQERNIATEVIPDDADKARIALENYHGLDQDEEILEYREKLRRESQRIIEAKKLPDYGETRTWINATLPEKEIENPNNPNFSFLTWNIKNGIQLDGQITYLKRIGMPDVLCLQEVDIDCMRSGNKNIALELAQALGYKYVVFTTSRVEIDEEDTTSHRTKFPNSKREKEIGRGGGVIGEAILSRYPLESVGCIKLQKLWMDYENVREIKAKVQPTIGGRIAQKVKLRIGNRSVVIYNTHLENLSGPTGRLAQYDQISKNAEDENNPTIIVGDFNTCGHGLGNWISEEHIYRKFPYKRPESAVDPLQKTRRFGETEAEFWARTELQDKDRKKIFVDPNGYKKATLKKGPFKGKLDWTLIEDGKFRVLDKQIGPTGLSDHQALYVSVQIS